MTREGITANAMSTYIEIANRFPDDPRPPKPMDRLAESDVEVQAPRKEQDARRTLTSLVQKYPASPWAPRALLMRGDIEAIRRRISATPFSRLGTNGGRPHTANRRALRVERCGRAGAEQAGAASTPTRSGFEMAASTFQELATRDEDDRYDAWSLRRNLREALKDNARAKEAYSHVLRHRRITPRRETHHHVAASCGFGVGPAESL